MKEIKFTKLLITNFRNINSLEINFSNNITEITGENGLGKTNTLSAILWCLFGKDIQDNKQFTISPIIDGIEKNDITTNVKLIINNDYIVSRTYYKRVVTLQTGYIGNDGAENLANISQSNFQEELRDKLVSEETFKSLSNINYIPNLHWKDLKKLIFELIGDISNEEVLLRDNFLLIEEMITKLGTESTQTSLYNTDKELNEDIKRLETEYQTLVNTKEKYVSSIEDLETYKNRKKEIETIMFNVSKQQEELNKIRDISFDKRQKIELLKQKINKIGNDIEYNNNAIVDYRDLYIKNSYNIEDIRKDEINIVSSNIFTLKTELKGLESQIIFKESHIRELKDKGDLLKLKVVKIENNKCNSCGQLLPKELIENTLNKLNEENENKLLEIKKEYDSEKQKLITLELEKENYNKQLIELEKEIENIKVKVYENITETDKQKMLRVSKEEKEIANIQLLKDKDSAEKELNILLEEYNKLEKPTEIFQDNTPLLLELDDINSKLATTITLDKISYDVANTLNKLNIKKDNKVLNKEKINQLIKFNNVKADLLQKKVKNYFTFINFKTKETTQAGEEVETFKIVNDKGVEFKEVNTGLKILMGIELVQVIQNLKELTIPILIDNLENVTSNIDNKGKQIIICKAVKDIKKLNVEYIERN
ncbi:MAG: AAA family ATPase [Bacilli bacterium]